MGILTSSQAIFLDEFFTSILEPKFFLTGGTALAAYYLHHRLSEDLDFFTIDQNADFAAVSAQMNRLINRLNYKIENQVSTHDFLQFILIGKRKDLLKIDLVKDIPVHFGEIKKQGNVFVDSLENIAVGKLLAVFGRSAPKDFIDLYFLLEKEKKITFEKIFELAKKKDAGLSEFYLAGMLSHVSDIKDFPKTIKPCDKKDMVSFFMDLSDKLYKKIKPVK